MLPLLILNNFMSNRFEVKSSKSALFSWQHSNPYKSTGKRLINNSILKWLLLMPSWHWQVARQTKLSIMCDFDISPWDLRLMAVRNICAILGTRCKRPLVMPGETGSVQAWQWPRLWLIDWLIDILHGRAADWRSDSLIAMRLCRCAGGFSGVRCQDRGVYYSFESIIGELLGNHHLTFLPRCIECRAV